MQIGAADRDSNVRDIISIKSFDCVFVYHYDNSHFIYPQKAPNAIKDLTITGVALATHDLT